MGALSQSEKISYVAYKRVAPRAAQHVNNEPALSRTLGSLGFFIVDKCLKVAGSQGNNARQGAARHYVCVNTFVPVFIMQTFGICKPTRGL